MWVARDKDKVLYLYCFKPFRDDSDMWLCKDQHGFTDANYYLELPPESYPDLTWEDEPIEVELVRK